MWHKLCRDDPAPISHNPVPRMCCKTPRGVSRPGYHSIMCSTHEQRIAQIGRAIDDLAAQAESAAAGGATAAGATAGRAADRATADRAAAGAGTPASGTCTRASGSGYADVRHGCGEHRGGQGCGLCGRRRDDTGAWRVRRRGRHLRAPRRVVGSACATRPRGRQEAAYLRGLNQARKSGPNATCPCGRGRTGAVLDEFSHHAQPAEVGQKGLPASIAQQKLSGSLALQTGCRSTALRSSAPTVAP